MKTIFTTTAIFALFIMTFSAKAQLVTISETHQIPVIGDSIRYINANTFGFDALGTGPVTNKVWDFAALMNAGSTVDFVFVNPSTLLPSDGKDSFPSANIAKRQSDANGYFYYQNNATSINRIGAYVKVQQLLPNFIFLLLQAVTIIQLIMDHTLHLI
jgi:hypothetical protein